LKVSRILYLRGCRIRRRPPPWRYGMGASVAWLGLALPRLPAP